MTVFFFCVDACIVGQQKESEGKRKRRGSPPSCQVLIVNQCVMFFFCCTLPEINGSPFTVVGRWCCHPARREGGLDGRKLGREVQKEKEWLSADSRSLPLAEHRLDCASGSLEGGKHTTSLR